MTNFQKRLLEYKQFKQRKSGKSTLTHEELKRFRESFKEENTSVKKINEASSKKSAYAEWKAKKRVESLKEKRAQKLGTQKVAEKTHSFAEYLKAYKAKKLAETKKASISKEELKKIRESYRASLPQKSKITESVLTLRSKTVGLLKRLKEEEEAVAVEEGAVEAVTDATVEGAAPAPATEQVDVIPAVEQLLSQVNALAAQLGITPPAVDTGANPEAGVPAVDGQPVEGAVEATTDQPVEAVQESKAAKMKAIRERIAAREAKIKGGKLTEEKAVASTIEVPNTATLVKGNSVVKETIPVTRWPNKKISDGGKVQEQAQPKDSSYAEAYLNKKLNEEKLDFEAIRQSMAKGFLG